MKLSKKQRLSRMIVLVILIVITGLSLSLIIGHYFSLAPLKEVARKESLELDQADPAYEATWAKALDQQRNLKGRYIGIGIIISLLTSTILMFFWDSLYRRKRLMGNIYRGFTIVLSVSLAVSLISVTHYLVHSYLYGQMHWYSYLANRFRINNIVVFLSMIIIPICLALGAIASYFLIERFLYPSRDIKILTSQFNNNAKKTQRQNVLN
ncbi:MAG TPA: hypothetical protein GXX72_02015 [Clostridiaceae bacterium]|nr:hypothetical protein [Clostridiaceae bacterium]